MTFGIALPAALVSTVYTLKCVFSPPVAPLRCVPFLLHCCGCLKFLLPFAALQISPLFAILSTPLNNPFCFQICRPMASMYKGLARAVNLTVAHSLLPDDDELMLNVLRCHETY